MKRTIYSTAFAIFCFVMAVGTAHAQVDTNEDVHTIGIAIPTVALVDIEPAASKNITMNFVAPEEAGLPIDAPADNSTLWLNYSVIPSALGLTADVSVAIDALIPGMDINVTAAAYSGTGEGTTGGSAGLLTLTTTGQEIVQNIGASYTGTGANNGHNLTYSLDVHGGSDYADLFASTPTVTVTYTISE